MSRVSRPVAAAAVLLLVAAGASPAHAQSPGGSAPSYSSGAYPRYPSTGAVLGTGGLGFNASPLYGGFRGGYGGVAGYGGASYYSSQPQSGYRSNAVGSGVGSRGLFGGWRRNR